MPFTVDEYNMNKVSFVAAPKKDKIYLITHNYVKAHIVTDNIILDGNSIKIKDDMRSNVKKLFFKKQKEVIVDKIENEVYDSEDDDENELAKKKDKLTDKKNQENQKTYDTNFNKLVNCINTLKKNINDDYIKKSYNNKTPITDSYYDLILSVRTNDSGSIHGLINYNGSKFNITFDDLKYILGRKLKCKIEVCPEYFYIGKNTKGVDDFRLGLLIKNIIIEEDQLDKFPKNLHTIIKYGADQNKINDIKALKDLYTKPIKPSYKSKRDIINTIMEK